MWKMLVGIPDWLSAIGLLGWLQRLDPLDKWVAATATFAAVVVALFVALFQDRIRIAMLRAKLDVRVEPGVTIPCGHVPAHHYRLGVTAEGSIAGHFVEILVTELWMAGQKAAWWSPMALGWTDGNQPHRDILSGDTTRLCDFIMMVEPGNQAQNILAPGGFGRPKDPDFYFLSNAGIRIMTAVTPRGGVTALLPGKYVIALELSAQNAKPSKRFFEIEFGGRWGVDPNAGLISIKKVGGPPA